jgi:two-component system CheB/CheR fusion protein
MSRDSRLNALKVLLVEDSEDILFIMRTELEWLGYTTEVARDGRTGLELAKGMTPDVIVSDIHMPGMDGFEFIEHVRQIPELSSVPVIALTGFGREHDVQRALAGGFAAHLTKPVDPDDLSTLIQRLTQKAEGAGTEGAGTI